ncbi:type II toxin-antitoxin system RelE/ParE family toxin [Roseateles saccharophilus]|uniref:Addiction module RelE/StbE family toxin n=1 Tax=Roseateles saccharophilus TaxID=304 RepID=A0A4R3U4I5_ROSSA|nr:type II toxin-antitoxin system RelE/ParE family toxin [Roseateles saccharophilus]MDG0836172.1 type II toxin-antitoxin system RelE/ParE family toxin [Roseateles saccharophilus]TCU81739.1 addiction module RelE/StbE family toxin [Roseateles saccharophilus]
MPAKSPAQPLLEWRPQASANLLLIIAEIAEDNPDAADNLMNEIESKAVALLDNPKLYKVSPRAKGLREMVIRPNYLVFYRESPTLVEIVNVIHARRQWPPIKRKAK